MLLSNSLTVSKIEARTHPLSRRSCYSNACCCCWLLAQQTAALHHHHHRHVSQTLQSELFFFTFVLLVNKDFSVWTVSVSMHVCVTAPVSQMDDVIVGVSVLWHCWLDVVTGVCHHRNRKTLCSCRHCNCYVGCVEKTTAPTCCSTVEYFRKRVSWIRLNVIVVTSVKHEPQHACSIIIHWYLLTHFMVWTLEHISYVRSLEVMSVWMWKWNMVINILCFIPDVGYSMTSPEQKGQDVWASVRWVRNLPAMFLFDSVTDFCLWSRHTCNFRRTCMQTCWFEP